ncbi:type II secretion system protein [Leptospira langatensis]|uniref:Type II secretion system protein n=1 Tax=Leptospira langatensis TaxID=2484983 RepID=A0A5F2A0J8_9LEPT|nr:type II secretion system protein [Leptospira langatensis]TGK04269.1 type II secretion system protein [Leptospira langatensis]TGL43749.1 type II secretion system protein [Leptospira langatensis]
MKRTVRANSKRNFLKRRRSGFTILEMVLAIGIASAWLAYVLMTVAEGVRLKKFAALQMEAAHLAKIKMAQIDSATILQEDTTSGEIPGYKDWKFTTIIKDENLDLLKLSGKGGKRPEDLLGGNSAQNDLIAKRTGNNQGSATGGLINVFHIYVTIEYPTGGRDQQGNLVKEQYTVETFKARMN